MKNRIEKRESHSVKNFANLLALFITITTMGVIFTACKDNTVSPEYKEAEGKIVGFTKNYYLLDNDDKLHYRIGLFIMVDSTVLLSFSNIDYQSLGLEPDNWTFSVHSLTTCFDGMYGGSIKIRFKYRNSMKNEIIDKMDYIVPYPAICPAKDFETTDEQIIITNIEKEN